MIPQWLCADLWSPSKLAQAPVVVVEPDNTVSVGHPLQASSRSLATEGSDVVIRWVAEPDGHARQQVPDGCLCATVVAVLVVTTTAAFCSSTEHCHMHNLALCALHLLPLQSGARQSFAGVTWQQHAVASPNPQAQLTASPSTRS